MIILATYLTPDILTIILLIYPINLGQKILYPLGHATGDLRSRMRSQAMNRQLNAVGLYDSIDTRAYLSVHLYLVYYDNTNVAQIQPKGYKIKESFIINGAKRRINNGKHWG